jgi:predicted unusual protein kinase regulating ubiquinone biosynthesis (AarF/ABC1/UbiB family)
VVISDDGKFVLYDVGIVAEYTDKDHQLIVDILTAFIYYDGRKAGRLMIDDWNTRISSTKPEEKAIDEDHYIDAIEKITIAASDENYFMEYLGTYISYFCEMAAKHHVMINPSFISAALAIKVQEGIALALDPTVPIKTVAIPIILKAEGRHKLVRKWSLTKSYAAKLLGRE